MKYSKYDEKKNFEKSKVHQKNVWFWFAVQMFRIYNQYGLLFHAIKCIYNYAQDACKCLNIKTKQIFWMFVFKKKKNLFYKDTSTKVKLT